MKLTVDSDEPLDRVLEVVGSLYGVRLSIAPDEAGSTSSPAVARPRATRSAGRRRITKKATSKRPASKSTRARKSAAPDPATVRAWARDNGLPVQARGRVPAEIVQAYTEGTSRR